MDLTDLVRAVQRHGAKLTVEGERLIIEGAGPRLPDDLRQALSRHKPELLVLLTQAAAEPGPEPFPRPSAAADTGQNSTVAAEPLATWERQRLLAWAAALAEQETVLTAPVSFVEAPLRRVTTAKVSEYAARYLRTISTAQSRQQGGTWGTFTTEWWRVGAHAGSPPRGAHLPATGGAGGRRPFGGAARGRAGADAGGSGNH